MSGNKDKYPDDFKEKVVAVAIVKGSNAVASRKYDVPKSTVADWVRARADDPELERLRVAVREESIFRGYRLATTMLATCDDLFEILLEENDAYLKQSPAMALSFILDLAKSASFVVRNLAAARPKEVDIGDDERKAALRKALERYTIEKAEQDAAIPVKAE